MGHGQERQPRNETQPLTRGGAVATPSKRAAGRAAHEDAGRRGGLEMSEACRDRALQERDKSRAQASDAELKSLDATKINSEMESSVSPGKKLRLAAEDVKTNAEEGRLQADKAAASVLVRLHVSTPVLAAAVLPTYTNNILVPRTLLVLGILCAVAAAAAAAAVADKVVTIQPIFVMCVTFRYVLIGVSMMIFFKL